MSSSTNPAAAGWSLLYVADPLCSWCYGFAPSLAAVHARWPQLPIELVLGGLRVEGEPLDARLRGLLQHHWDEVARRSGQLFVPDALQREGFVYTTEPACRAVVTVRELALAEDPASAPAQALAMFHAIQVAFYAEGRDATDAELLADVAQRIGVDRARFASAFADAAMQLRTQEDFVTAQRLGIRGFPALAAVREGQGRLLAQGWLAPEELLARLETEFGA
ncbi:DsbA family protein [Rivibacter subsaxonicus]|uniref:DSBA-like thioredoxin domain-containing protein n=1 Tax=Rivibacter subsaxonicus TaxID=457575 RepID=A0A4Q7W090_9BURK|nr:DsbA family protein [Rivibacter subsaxonicus]RZU02567.1 putative protein-disulfide isomerase [Rivibacter subsaxonicus]